MKTGSEILLECLKSEGVDLIFGYPGGVLVGFYDALFSSTLKHVLPRHEQGGVHAADGYARATGKVGVCLATSGPGATNLVTGIATAYMDSIPMVVLTGQISTNLIGGDAFQEVDIVGITRPIVKHSYLVRDVAELADTLKEAFHIARTGRAGPVLIDLPKDVLQARYKYEPIKKVVLSGYQPNEEGHPMQIKKMLKRLETAKRPLVLVGGGLVSSNGSEELIKFVNRINIPVATTFMAQGGFPASNSNYIGWLGMHGNYASNMAVTEADYIIAIGTRFTDRSTGNLDSFASKTDVAHIDFDPSSISKNVQVNIPIVGNAKNVLVMVNKYIEDYKWDKNNDERLEWLKVIAVWNKEQPFSYKFSDRIIKPQYVIERIYHATNGDAIITTDVGQHQMWAAQFYKYSFARQFISSGGLGTMGFGLPSAMGAKLGRPDKEVFSIVGDGGILMNIQELMTCVQYRIGVKVAILNNRFLGMVRQWQELFFDKKYSYTCLESQPDFAELAKSFGAVGLYCDKPSDVDAVLKEAMRVTDIPVLLNFMTAREENVYPMVPAGAAIKDMIIR